MSDGTTRSIKVNPSNFLQILSHVEGIVRDAKLTKMSSIPKSFQSLDCNMKLLDFLGQKWSQSGNFTWSEVTQHLSLVEEEARHPGRMVRSSVRESRQRPTFIHNLSLKMYRKVKWLNVKPQL